MSKDIDDLIMQLVDNEQPEGGRSEDEDAVDEYGPDLYKDEEDRRRLLALPEVERERILSERSEERQRNLERLEVRKLLNEGRREDTTRRSTRTKDSTTSRALSELTKRREEKSRSRSKRSAEQPAFEKRRKVASPTGESEEEYSEEEDVRDLEKTSERKEKKRHPTYEEIQSIWLPRELIGQWLYTPYFENTVIGSMVRIYIGKDNDGKDTYRACEVLDVVPYHKSYKISEKYWCDKALMLKHGEAEKTFTMDIISNSLFTHHEYERLIKQCEYDKAPVPSVQHVEEKAKDIERAKTYVLNEKEVTEMVEKKRLARGGQYYTNKDIAQLHVKLEYARSINDISQINELTEKLNSIRRSGEKRLDDVSQSRRIQSLIQQRKLEQEQKEKKKLYQEPFQPPRYQPGSKVRKPKFMDFAKSLPFFM